ncbi:hypothetical protein CSA37_06770 [Candidatus Fermentibacteria bacterium]|nr:MAG: hypothetical protein CSA37_06770 [Candidatus Fermentibacteria bacterium]
MFIEVVGASGSKNSVNRVICMRLGENVLIDAGSASFIPPEQLNEVNTILLTHAHLDHILDLGFILDSMVHTRETPLVVTGSEACLSIVREHYMNGLIWPDFSRIRKKGNPLLEYCAIEDETWTVLEPGLECMSIPVNHSAGARGFLFRSEGKILVYSGDTGPTEFLWQRAREEGCPEAVVIEVSFPDSMRNIAMASDHLCPSTAADELRKLGCCDIPVYLFHMKPWFRDVIEKETASLQGNPVAILRQGYRILFGNT